MDKLSTRMSRGVVLVGIVALVASAALAGDILFLDEIKGYAEDVLYPDQNPDVYATQYTVRNPSYVMSSMGIFSAAPPNQFVRLSSDALWLYTTNAVDVSTTARYVQVLIRAGYDGPGNFMRFSLFDDTNPAFLALEGDTSQETNTMFDLIWHPNNLLKWRYRTAKAHALDQVTWPDGQSGLNVGPGGPDFANVTANVDLDANTFDLYLNDLKIASDVLMPNDGGAGPVGSMAVGGMYWFGEATGAALDYWHLLQSDQPFTEAGTQIVVVEDLVGDANRDGVVDDADLSLLLANWNQDVTRDPDGGWGKGEFDASAPVQDADLSLLLANWTGSPDSVGIPEPAALSLLTVSAVVLVRRRRQQCLSNREL